MTRNRPRGLVDAGPNVHRLSSPVGIFLAFLAVVFGVAAVVAVVEVMRRRWPSAVAQGAVAVGILYAVVIAALWLRGDLSDGPYRDPEAVCAGPPYDRCG